MFRNCFGVMKFINTVAVIASASTVNAKCDWDFSQFFHSYGSTENVSSTFKNGIRTVAFNGAGKAGVYYKLKPGVSNNSASCDFVDMKFNTGKKGYTVIGYFNSITSGFSWGNFLLF